MTEHQQEYLDYLEDRGTINDTIDAIEEAEAGDE